MCGIFGFISKDKIKGIPLVIGALKRLEYRGYDSAGIVAISSNKVLYQKKSGRIFELEKCLDNDFESNIAIGHNRWATHGQPTDKNAHPHHDCHKKIFLVHNGIIENYKELKDRLIENGHRFLSDTDTEVVAHLV